MRLAVVALSAILSSHSYQGLPIVYALISLTNLIDLAAKNAILIVEFVKERNDRDMPLIRATVDAVDLRLRHIGISSMTFMTGAFAEGAGAVARSTIGRTVLGGMLAATLLAIFILPVLFVVITRLAYDKKQLATLELKVKNEAGDNPELNHT